MNIEELLTRESIRQTITRYTMAGDRLRVQEFLEVFTADAILESEEVGASDTFLYQGKKEIGAWLQRWRDLATEPSALATQATFVRHHISTSDIVIVDADSAKARTYWTAYTDIGPDHCGYYVDSFQKVKDQWLIQHRKVRLDWRSPNSLFTMAINNTR
ncbi:nuclear transport factor 2 family protein [Halioxenophilus sp. WMMB6]|uniref:nuclear transport factor 2 family protein n=1 Tax=Halioxenophilus sp. WMMB6 TaxID=3073815 RepID=UPI00295E9E39|nr:nuclear transport factor 2 family protein [Halioxenophilus sp. WMMB6]